MVFTKNKKTSYLVPYCSLTDGQREGECQGPWTPELFFCSSEIYLNLNPFINFFIFIFSMLISSLPLWIFMTFKSCINFIALSMNLQCFIFSTPVFVQEMTFWQPRHWTNRPYVGINSKLNSEQYQRQANIDYYLEIGNFYTIRSRRCTGQYVL